MSASPADERARLVEIGMAEATEWIEGVGGASANSVTFSVFNASRLVGTR
jgi:hypothetical protein